MMMTMQAYPVALGRI